MSYQERGKRDGTGPHKESYQKKQGMGKRQERGEECPKKKDLNRGYRKV